MLKFWLANGSPRIVPSDESSDRYSWNGTCLLMKMPDYINDITPTRKTSVLESMDGTPYIFTDSHAERFDLVLSFILMEKELLALREFMYAVSQNKRTDKDTDFNYPFMWYDGLEDICDIALPDSDYIAYFLPQDLEYSEYTTDEEVALSPFDENAISRKYKVTVPIRIAKFAEARIKRDQYIVKIIWPGGTQISLGYDSAKVGGETIYGWLSSLSGLSANSAIDGFGSVSNVTVSIAAYMQYNELDEDHPLRNVDRHIETITEATVEIWYNNIVLFKGTPHTPYTWDSATREISFDCVMNARSDEMGYQIDYDGMNPLLKSTQNWPHVFGSVLMQAEPLCKTPETTMSEDVYVSFTYADPANNVYESGTAFNIPIASDSYWSLPTGEHHWLIHTESGNIRLKGMAMGSNLVVTDFNIPWLCVPGTGGVGYSAAQLQVVEMIQYETGYVDAANYQPNTLIINELDVPYMVGKHIRAEAYKWVYTINALGRFVPNRVTFYYWATVIGQNGNVIYINDIKEEEQNRTILLSGWTTTFITHVMENRLFRPQSYEMLPIPDVRQQRAGNDSLEQRMANIEAQVGVSFNNQFGYYLEQYLALHLKAGTKITCTDWLFDKLYPISLDSLTNVNNAYQQINNKIYKVPVKTVYLWKDDTFFPIDYETGPWIAPVGDDLWDLEELRPYMPDECVFMLLYDIYDKVYVDVVNNLANDPAAFQFILEKYMDLEGLDYAYGANLLLPTNCYTRDKVDVRGWLANFAKEHGKRIVVHMDRTTELIPIFTGIHDGPTWTTRSIDPVHTYTKKDIEALSIKHDSVGIEQVINQLTLSIPNIDDKLILKGDQKYPKAETSYTIATYWRYEIWRYWINWTSKVWRKIEFKTFLTHALPSPLETIQINTPTFTGKCVVESVAINGFSVLIKAFTEEEII